MLHITETAKGIQDTVEQQEIENKPENRKVQEAAEEVRI